MPRARLRLGYVLLLISLTASACASGPERALAPAGHAAVFALDPPRAGERRFVVVRDRSWVAVQGYLVAADATTFTVEALDGDLVPLPKVADFDFTCEQVDLDDHAARRLRELRRRFFDGEDLRWSRAHAELVGLAWACDAVSLTARAIELRELAARIHDPDTGRPPASLEECARREMALDVQRRLCGEVVSRPRRDVVAHADRAAALFPGPEGAWLRETAKIVRLMANEEELQAAARPSTAAADPVADLISALREEQEPGLVTGSGADIFGRRCDGAESIASRLRALGPMAVPLLTKASRDRRFTRQLDHDRRSPLLTAEVLRVGDCATLILRAISEDASGAANPRR